MSHDPSDAHHANETPVPARPVSVQPASHVTYAVPVPRGRPPWHPLRRLTRHDAGLDLSLVLMVGLVIPFGVQAGMLWLTPAEQWELTASHWLLALGKWFDALLLVVLAAYFVYRHRISADDLGLRSTCVGWQVLWSLVTLFAVYLVFFVMLLVVGVLVSLFPELQQDLMEREKFMEMLPLENFWLGVLLLIPVAIHEEMLFRGLLMPYLHRLGCQWWGAVAISTFIFASLHITQGVLGVVQIMGVGAVLGVAFVLTRSTLVVIIAHFLFNLIQLQLARVIAPHMDQWMHELEQVSEAALF